MSQTFTLCEIAENNGKDGKPVWLTIKGVVYDVTRFLNEHPGGEESILEYAGKDATKAFNDVGHSTDAIQEMKLYKIGVVSNECAQVCGAVDSANQPIATEPECYRRQKKRIKLFFCF